MHRKLVRKPGIISSALLVLVTCVGVLVWSDVSDGIILYIRVARLYAKEPDRHLAMPVANVAKREIANTWYAPRGHNRRHEGQDIFAPRGTAVISATDGYVFRIGENSLGGRTVSVIGAGGRLYYYAHLESYARNLFEGDRVSAQTVLGYVGDSGNAIGTPPHLHFGVYTSGTAINPLPLLIDRPLPLSTARRR